MQLGRATFVQPNLSFSTKSNYSIMMENMEIFTNWHLICRHGHGILFQFLVFLCLWSQNKQVLFAAFAGSPISIILSPDEFN